MRILIENNFYAPEVVGGAELSVQGIADGLARRGHEVSLITCGVQDDTADLNGVRVYRRAFRALMPYQRHLASRVSIRKVLNKALVIDNPMNRAVIEGVLDKTGAEAVLSNNLLGVTPELWRCATKRRVPLMHTIRDYSLMCPTPRSCVRVTVPAASA